ncbi:MAG: transcriptional regulator, partial [Desulfobacteraceae bacterium]|nr:transcriptional regulator [Desulfobacteraceae bacterium]
MDILHSKLNAPRRYKILHRKRLTRLFSEIFQKKLITVTAGAGFGKTTLVMDALAGLKAVPVWYRLDEQDNDFPVFMSYLYAAVQHHFLKSRDPGIKKPLKKTNLKNQTDLLLDWMVFLEKNAVPNTVLILDDYHLVQDSESINQAIEYILCRLPEYIHLVIISRKNLSLPLSTIRSREQLLEINENDLSFTPGEIKSFYTNIYRLLLTDTHIEDIHSSTRGWAASLVLLQYAFRSKTPKAITKSLKTFKSNPQYIFSYLEENIFNAQPEHIKTFMLKTSLLHEIDTRRCKQFFDMEHADTILKQMIKDHLLIFPVDESETIFYLHHLFRNFLSLKLKQTFSSDKINQLHRKIAIQMEGEDIFLALHHYIEGEMFDEAVRVIKTHEMKFLIEGKTNFLRQCMEKIPKPIIEKNPQLLMAQAKLFSYFGNPGKAVELLTHAHLLFKKQNSTEDMIKCLVELGSQYYFTGHVREAKLLMEQVLDEVEQRSITYVIAMTYLIFLSAVLGDFDVACAYYETAFEVIQDYDDFERRGSIAMLNTSYTSIHYFCGDFELSQKLNKKLLAWMFELNIELGLPLVYYHFAAASFYLNEYEQGMDYAKKGIQVCKKIDLLDSRKAWIYLAYAQNCLGIGKLDKAIKFIDNSIDLFEEPGNRWGLANAWDCLHQIYLAQGKIILAKQILIQAMDIIKGYQLVLTEGILDVSMANIFIIEKDYLPALKHLDRSRTKLKDAAYHLFTNHLLSSRAF